MASRTLLWIASLASVPLAWAGSPTYNEIFQNPLPLSPIATPASSANVNGQQIDFYEVTIEPFQKQVYPDLGPANLVGYNGVAPGPRFYIQKGTQTVIRYHNNHTDDSVVHLHGSWTHTPWDGWPSDSIHYGQFKDYYYPNDQNARSIWYHDHADGITSSNCFRGLVGTYVIYDPEEDKLGLPTGKYDVPLMMSDKMYTDSGDLIQVGNEQNDFIGDVMEVNGQPWPYLEVEPRKYRFRLYNTAVSRPFDLHVEQSNGDRLDFQVIASDSGLFGSPVQSSDVTMAMGERYEIVVDFSNFANQNLTLKNTFSLEGQGLAQFDNMDLVMSFVVGGSVSDWSSNEVSSILNQNIIWPQDKDEIDHTFRFQRGGDAAWTIDGVDFNDINNRILARPPQGSTQRWRLVYAGGPGYHPVHIHLVDFKVLSRTGGSRGVLPYESAGLKDIVLLEPGETVDVEVYFGPWNGLYMFHCHNLIHEDHMMMASFNVTRLEVLGYDNVESLDDPDDTRFKAEDWSADAYSDSQIQGRLNWLGSLGAYDEREELSSAVAAYYSGNPNPPVETGNSQTSASSQTQSWGQNWQGNRGGRGGWGNQKQGRPWPR
ncbi:Cupredoxin [Aureobasidium pullulans]|uniref:Cupredoxin n=1 Tax=Aureobasidium pullulans TaxID=5580 RepID=A0A4S8SP52_AURPU|nr:Cupredoxin [Aureobasidium pullulans]